MSRGLKLKTGRRPPMGRGSRARLAAALAALSLLLSASACGSDSNDETSGDAKTTAAAQTPLPQGSEPVNLDPSEFTNEIDNPYWPMARGSKWVYQSAGGSSNERVEVTVTDKKKTVEGIEALVLRDVVTDEGTLVEVTDDWYGQDSKGNVWYLGEDTKEYENGKVVTTKGSWEHGVDGAQAGIIMPANPSPGLEYRQEYYEGEAEDAARVVSLDKSVEVPFGNFDGVLETEDFTPLEPNIRERKYYARDIGPVLKRSPGSNAREELVSFRKGG